MFAGWCWLLALSSVQAAEVGATPALELAYQKEMAYLSAERDALRARAEEGARTAARQLAAQQDEVARAQGRLLALQRANDAREEALAEAERAEAKLAAGREALNQVLTQIATSQNAPTPSEDAPLAEQLQALRGGWEQARRLLQADAARTKERGRFFLSDGKQVEGEILRFGRVAAWGVSAEARGALAPAGAGDLYLLEAGAEDAELLLGGSAPTAGFWFEGTEKRLEPSTEPTWEDQLEDGGPVGLVILAVGGLLILLAVVRLAVLALAGGADPRRGLAVAALLRAARAEEAERLSRSGLGAVARVTRLILAEREERYREATAELALATEADRLQRLGTAQVALAAVAPLLGLLGTVSGMISTFDVITELGAGNPKLLSGGISEALVTTKFGLLVAIPGVLVANLLNARASAVLAACETAAIALLEAGKSRDVA